METYDLGNPMNYQTLVLSCNDASFGSLPPLEAVLKDFGYVIDSPKIAEYLKSDTTLRLGGEIRFNGYGFTSPYEGVR